VASYDAELLTAARGLLQRRSGQRGKLPAARIRRSISTSYYALFHFIIEEVGVRVLGSRNALRARRRVLVRTLTHSGLKTTFNKLRGATVDATIAELLREPGGAAGQVAVPLFVQNLAKAFLDTQAKREDADYNLNEPLSESDARLVSSRVRRAIVGWRGATDWSDRDFKHAICVLLLLRGQLRKDGST